MLASVVVGRDLVKSYGARRVLHEVTVTASPGQRLGLVGENGAGKSTLLRLLAGFEEPDQGHVTRPEAVGFLQQEPPWSPDWCIRDVVEDALEEPKTIKARLLGCAAAIAEDPAGKGVLAAYAEALAVADAAQVWDAERRVVEVLAGLGLAQLDAGRALLTLSGGQRSRLALAALLIRQPQLLLLDEPSNHLDDEALDFLERHLLQFPGAVVLASHDRVLLDTICTSIVDLDPAQSGVSRYGGSYSQYVMAKRQERHRWELAFAHQQDEMAALQRAIAVTARQVSHNRAPSDNEKMAYDHKGGRVAASVSRRVRNARERLEDLSRSPVLKPPAPLRFQGTFNTDAPTEGLLLTASPVEVSGRVRVEQLSIGVGERLLITGPNGAGKSSLLAVLAGSLPPTTGVVQRRPGLRIGMLDQDSAFEPPDKTPLSIYTEAARGRPQTRSLMELGLLSPRDLTRPVGQLSVGQRRRLALALLLAQDPHLVLLDEPSNHLSLTLVEELEESLSLSPGAVVIATHDRWLRRRWNGRELTLAPIDDMGVELACM